VTAGVSRPDQPRSQTSCPSRPPYWLVVGSAAGRVERYPWRAIDGRARRAEGDGTAVPWVASSADARGCWRGISAEPLCRALVGQLLRRPIARRAHWAATRAGEDESTAVLFPPEARSLLCYQHHSFEALLALSGPVVVGWCCAIAGRRELAWCRSLDLSRWLLRWRHPVRCPAGHRLPTWCGPRWLVSRGDVRAALV